MISIITCVLKYWGSYFMLYLLFLLRFDIMLDYKLKPWLLEINHTPSFRTDTPLDLKIKRDLINDTLKLININLTTKRKILKKEKSILIKRVY